MVPLYLVMIVYAFVGIALGALAPSDSCTCPAVRHGVWTLALGTAIVQMFETRFVSNYT